MNSLIILITINTIIILLLLIRLISIYTRNNKKKKYIYNNVNLNNMSNFIVLKLVIPNKYDNGGFAWHLHHVQCLLYLCEHYHKIPIIYFNKGYYYDPKYGDNWWNYFFIPMVNNVIIQKVLEMGEKNNFIVIEKEDDLKRSVSNQPFLYTNTTFQRICRQKDINFVHSYLKIKLNDKYQKKINDFVKNYFNHKIMIGIHYRGTDKFPNYGGTEDLKNNYHLKYEDVIRHLQDYILKNKIDDYNLFIASDEQPFVDYVKKIHPNSVTYSSSRSTTSTQGMILDSRDCNDDTMEDYEVCKQFIDLSKTSIHRGNLNISPFKKGEDCIMDIWLLSNCNVFLRSHGGNFSSQPGRINKNLKVISI